MLSSPDQSLTIVNKDENASPKYQPICELNPILLLALHRAVINRPC